MAALLLAACAPSHPGHPSRRPGASLSGARPPAALPAEATPFQIVYLIHGDADYVWHDRSGARRLADQDALAQAREVAARLPAAEVLIFHQTPRRHHWAHPHRNGAFYHYRGGRLLRREDYSRAGRGGGLRAEAALFRRHAAGSAPRARFLVWFGHEIPLQPHAGYSRSLPGEAFSLADLLRALDAFALAGPGSPSGKPYAFIALSACRGGTPTATAALFPQADYVLAAASRLHLSHLDTRAFIPWLADGSGAAPASLRAGAETLARSSFADLSARTVTGLTLSLYETDRASAWLAGRASSAPRPSGAPAHPDHMVDCSEVPGFGTGGAEAGVLVLHRPPRFGKRRGARAHSGWECPAPGAATAGTP